MKRYGMVFAFLIVLGATFALISCDGGGGGNGVPNIVEDCGNGVDDDGDTLVDCADAADCPVCPENCNNGLDDDGDTLIDCNDPNCGGCPEDCTNGADDDGDGAVDCADAGSCPPCTFCGPGNHVCGTVAAGNAGNCVPRPQSQCTPEICNNGVDDDGDLAIDCADSECNCAEDCTNGVDDDGDGTIDCADADCNCAEDCTNGIDDDGDGLTDCADVAACPPCTTCGNGNKVCGSPGSAAGAGVCANNHQQAGCP